ncbi:dienelactone hydrolase family protein [Mucilaginibacter corticis]|nr:dienelactone hydrolase family protein [Mucilaginibacter corticis]
MRRLLTSIFILCAFFTSAKSLNNRLFHFTKTGEDPFTPYLNSIPTVLQVISTVNSGSGDEAIVTKEIVFSSKNGVNKIYGIMAFPQRAGKFPGVLVIHAGDGNAQNAKGIIERLARKGYAAFACDMAGFCNTNTTPYSSGPWKATPAPDERPRFYLKNGPKSSSLVDAEVAGIEAFNLLRSQPNVDAEKMGITGYSWGSYSTTMLSGLLGDKVKAAYAFWGAGFFDKGTYWKKIIEDLPDSIRTTWLTYFDAGRRAPHIKANFFMEAAVNDTYFWVESVNATLQAIPKAKNHVWGPNVNHREAPTSALMQGLFFDYNLKGLGSPFGHVAISDVKSMKDSTKEVTIKLDIPSGVAIKTVQVYYSEPQARWDARKWMPLTATEKNKKTYTATIPVDLVKKNVNFYAHLTDTRGAVTSSDIY